MIKLKGKLNQAYKMRWYYLLALPMVLYFIIFHYVPIYGLRIAFVEYSIRKGIMGSPWIGLEHFERMINSPFFSRITINTFVISLSKLIFGFPAPIILALLLNEVNKLKFKKVVQTISYLPHFISWVVLSGIIIELLSPSRGVVNYVISLFGIEPIYFLSKANYFRYIVVITSIYKEVGWGTIVYLAAIAGIDPEQMDAAYIDGASRFQTIRLITIPTILPVISIVFLLNLGRILDAGFDQIFNLYNPMVYSTGDIIDTYVYRVGIEEMEFSFATAVGLLKNVIGLFLVLTTNSIIRRFSSKENALW